VVGRLFHAGAGLALHREPHMTQLAFVFPRIGPSYHRRWYWLNRQRRKAQRLASKNGCPKEWRLWLS
jgi:hypothetical protein